MWSRTGEPSFAALLAGEPSPTEVLSMAPDQVGTGTAAMPAAARAVGAPTPVAPAPSATPPFPPESVPIADRRPSAWFVAEPSVPAVPADPRSGEPSAALRTDPTGAAWRDADQGRDVDQGRKVYPAFEQPPGGVTTLDRAAAPVITPRRFVPAAGHLAPAPPDPAAVSAHRAAVTPAPAPQVRAPVPAPGPVPDRSPAVASAVEAFPDLLAPVVTRKGLARRRRQDFDVLAPQIPSEVPLQAAIRAYQASLEYVGWRPRLASFVLSFLVLAVYALWSFNPNRTVLGWVLSIVWSMPIVGTLVGLQGAFLLRRRVRRPGRMVPPTVSTTDTLLVVVPTIGRHDTYPALERSVLSFVEHLPVFFTRFRADVVVEEGCEAAERIAALGRQHPQIRVITVPRAYQTPRGTRFKARANHFTHELRIAEGEARDDVWVLHMDDDTAVGADTAAALAQFINRQRRAGDQGKHLAQGMLTYPRENAVNWLTWMADAVRPADDFARFRAVTGAGTPVAGLHGELLLMRASIEATIGWDFGPKAIVEDAQFALTFCKLYPGRSDWFNGRCYGASPATVRDFVKQRERWAWGLVGLSLNRSIPLRYRAFLGWSVLTWVLGPLQHLGVVLLVAWATGVASTSPVTETVLLLWAMNFAFVVWSYWEGLRLNAWSSGKRRRRWFEPFLVLLLIPVFALMEGIGGLRGFLKFLTRRENKFVVIAKPA